MHRAICALGLTLTLCSTLSAQDRVRSAKDFSFEGIGFSTSLDSFKKAKPEATDISKSDDKKKGVSFMSVGKNAAGTTAIFCFLDQDLYAIKLNYNSSIIKPRLIIERFEGALGKPDSKEPGTNPKRIIYIWNVKEANRNITVHDVYKETWVEVADNKLEDKLDERIKKARTGENPK